MVFKVRIIDNKILMTSGSKVIIHELNRSDMSTKLTHMLADHTRDVLCLDAEDDIVVSGGLDTNVLVYKLGPENAHQLVHTLTGHKLKVTAYEIRPLILYKYSRVHKTQQFKDS